MVVDCPGGKDQVVRAKLAEADAVLTDVFVTHGDLDHCGGVPALLEKQGAERVHLNFGWALPPERDAKVRVKAVLSSILSIVDRDGLQLKEGVAGSNAMLGAIEWSLLAPTRTSIGRSALTDNRNRSSMVILLEGHGTRVLITGDIDDVAIDHLVASGADLDTDVLLVPHHGARLDRLRKLLAAASPSVAVISAGRVNGYGHPHPSTLADLAATDGLRTMCTQVSRHCHRGDLDEPSCAGSTCVQLGAEPTISGIPAHEARVATLGSPICTTGSLDDA